MDLYESDSNLSEFGEEKFVNVWDDMPDDISADITTSFPYGDDLCPTATEDLHDWMTDLFGGAPCPLLNDRMMTDDVTEAGGVVGVGGTDFSLLHHHQQQPTVVKSEHSYSLMTGSEESCVEQNQSSVANGLVAGRPPPYMKSESYDNELDFENEFDASNPNLTFLVDRRLSSSSSRIMTKRDASSSYDDDIDEYSGDVIDVTAIKSEMPDRDRSSVDDNDDDSFAIAVTTTIRREGDSRHQHQRTLLRQHHGQSVSQQSIGQSHRSLAAAAKSRSAVATSSLLSRGFGLSRGESALREQPKISIKLEPRLQQWEAAAEASLPSHGQRGGGVVVAADGDGGGSRDGEGSEFDVLPLTPPGSSTSDSEGGSQSPQRSVPSSPESRGGGAGPVLTSRRQHSYGHPYGQPLFTSPIPTSGVLLLTEEETQTLIAEGYPIPTRLPLSKQDERKKKKVPTATLR